MNAVVVGREEYRGFGRCIYCESDGGEAGLRDEHIIPFALGGNAVILREAAQDAN